MNGDLDPDLYTYAGDAAEIVGVSSTTMRRWARNGRLDHLTTPAGWRLFKLGDLYALCDARQTEQEADR